VMETCDDAAVSKLSAVQKGYYKVVIMTCSGGKIVHLDIIC
jgi:hypothetical protein